MTNNFLVKNKSFFQKYTSSSCVTIGFNGHKQICDSRNETVVDEFSTTSVMNMSLQLKETNNDEIYKKIRPSFTWSSTIFMSSDENPCLQIVGTLHSKVLCKKRCFFSWTTLKITDFKIYQNDVILKLIFSEFSRKMFSASPLFLFIVFDEFPNFLFLFTNNQKNQHSEEELCENCLEKKNLSFKNELLGKFVFPERITRLCTKGDGLIIVQTRCGSVFYYNPYGESYKSKYETNHSSNITFQLNCLLCIEKKYFDDYFLNACQNISILFFFFFKKLDIFSEVVNPNNTKRFVICDVSCGLRHGIMKDNFNRMWSFGDNSFGQLGQEKRISNGIFYEKPETIKLLEGMMIEDFDCGFWHNAVVTQDGDVYTWGWNKHSQLGKREDPNENNDKDGFSYIPQYLDSRIVAKRVACGSRHTVVVDEEEKIFGWGWAKYGQIGQASFINTTEQKENEKCSEFPTEISINSRYFGRINDLFCGYWSTFISLSE